MRNELILSFVLMLLAFMISGCLGTKDNANESKREDQTISQSGNETVTTRIFGSAESPDPILAEVLKLEKKGILKDVNVMESFPLQINVTGPANVIERLKKLPRKKLTAPE